MRVAELLEKTHEELSPGWAEVVLQETSIWTNDACYGYCLAAMEKAGLDRATMEKVRRGLHEAFDELTVEEAERKWVRW